MHYTWEAGKPRRVMEHIHDGDCWVEGYHSGNYTLDSDEWATRICDSCAARAALAAPKDAP